MTNQIARTLWRLRWPQHLKTALGDVVITDHVLESTVQLPDGRRETLLLAADSTGHILNDIELMCQDPRAIDRMATPVV